jgi:hypothetical protein
MYLSIDRWKEVDEWRPKNIICFCDDDSDDAGDDDDSVGGEPGGGPSDIGFGDQAAFSAGVDAGQIDASSPGGGAFSPSADPASFGVGSEPQGGPSGIGFSGIDFTGGGPTGAGWGGGWGGGLGNYGSAMGPGGWATGDFGGPSYGFGGSYSGPGFGFQGDFGAPVGGALGAQGLGNIGSQTGPGMMGGPSYVGDAERGSPSSFTDPGAPGHTSLDATDFSAQSRDAFSAAVGAKGDYQGSPGMTAFDIAASHSLANAMNQNQTQAAIDTQSAALGGRGAVTDAAVENALGAGGRGTPDGQTVGTPGVYEVGPTGVAPGPGDFGDIGSNPGGHPTSDYGPWTGADPVGMTSAQSDALATAAQSLGVSNTVGGPAGYGWGGGWQGAAPNGWGATGTLSGAPGWASDNPGLGFGLNEAGGWLGGPQSPGYDPFATTQTAPTGNPGQPGWADTLGSQYTGGLAGAAISGLNTPSYDPVYGDLTGGRAGNPMTPGVGGEPRGGPGGPGTNFGGPIGGPAIADYTAAMNPSTPGVGTEPRGGPGGPGTNFAGPIGGPAIADYSTFGTPQQAIDASFQTLSNSPDAPFANANPGLLSGFNNPQTDGRFGPGPGSEGNHGLVGGDLGGIFSAPSGSPSSFTGGTGFSALSPAGQISQDFQAMDGSRGPQAGPEEIQAAVQADPGAAIQGQLGPQAQSVALSAAITGQFGREAQQAVMEQALSGQLGAQAYAIAATFANLSRR